MYSLSDEPPVRQVLRRVRARRNAGVWPGQDRVQEVSWLRNFPQHDQPIASTLLDSLVFFSDSHCEKLLESAFDSYCRTILDHRVIRSDNSSRLHSHFKNVCFCPVEGEIPNPTDSGWLLCRMVRQVLRVPESQIVTPARALDRAEVGYTVLFVDDFCGTGSQFSKSWSRDLRGNMPRSFRDLQELLHTRKQVISVGYIPLLATESSLRRLQREVPEAKVLPGHVLGPDYSINSRELPAGLERTEVVSFLSRHAPQLITESFIDPCLGFGKLGLAIAMSHSVPDSTLPILWARGRFDWSPLVPRL